jgi:hypothetical protein
MEWHRFKLGDKVEVQAGDNQRVEGHIIGILSQPSGSNIIEVRIDQRSLKSIKVTPKELRHAP